MNTDQVFMTLMERAEAKKREHEKQGFFSRHRHKIALGLAGAYVAKKAIDKYAPDTKERVKDIVRKYAAPDSHNATKTTRRVAKVMKTDALPITAARGLGNAGAGYSPLGKNIIIDTNKYNPKKSATVGTIAHELGHHKTIADAAKRSEYLTRSADRYARRFKGRPGAMSSRDVHGLNAWRGRLSNEALATGAVWKQKGKSHRNDHLSDAFDTYRDAAKTDAVLSNVDKHMDKRLARFDKGGGLGNARVGLGKKSSHLMLSDTACIANIREANEEERGQPMRKMAKRGANYGDAARFGAAGATIGSGAALLHLGYKNKKIADKFPPELTGRRKAIAVIGAMGGKEGQSLVSPKYVKHITSAMHSRNPLEQVYHGVRAISHTPGARAGAAAGVGAYGAWKLKQHYDKKKSKESIDMRATNLREVADILISGGAGYYRGKQDAYKRRPTPPMAHTVGRWGAAGAGIGGLVGGGFYGKGAIVPGALIGGLTGAAHGGIHGVWRGIGRMQGDLELRGRKRHREASTGDYFQQLLEADMGGDKVLAAAWKKAAAEIADRKKARAREELMARLAAKVKQHSRPGASATAGALNQLARTTKEIAARHGITQESTDSYYATLMEVMRKDNPELLAHLVNKARERMLYRGDKDDPLPGKKYMRLAKKQFDLHDSIKKREAMADAASKTPIVVTPVTPKASGSLTPPVASPKWSTRKKLALGAGIAAGVGLAGYGAYRWQKNRQKQQAARESTDTCLNRLLREGTPETRKLGRKISRQFARISEKAEKTGERGDYFIPHMLKLKAQRLAQQARHA